jgi:hypothetical protein
MSIPLVRGVSHAREVRSDRCSHLRPPRNRRGEDARRNHPSGIGEREAGGWEGDSGEYEPMPVKVNDRVLFSQWSGVEIVVAGEKVLVMEIDQILGTLVRE